MHVLICQLRPSHFRGHIFVVDCILALDVGGVSVLISGAGPGSHYFPGRSVVIC